MEGGEYNQNMYKIFKELIKTSYQLIDKLMLKNEFWGWETIIQWDIHKEKRTWMMNELSMKSEKHSRPNPRICLVEGTEINAK